MIKKLIPLGAVLLDLFCLYKATFAPVYETGTQVVLPIPVQPLLLVNVIGFVLVLVLAD